MVNAYDIAEEAVIVDRAKLYMDDTTLAGDYEPSDPEPDLDFETEGNGDLLRQLQVLLDSSLNCSLSSRFRHEAPVTDTVDVTKDVSEEKRQKEALKKKKLNRETNAESTNPLFRLLPGPPVRISLTNPQYRGHALIRPAEDTATESVERKAKAHTAGVVVELDDILEQGQAMVSRKSTLQVFRVSEATGGSLPTILVTERERERPGASVQPTASASTQSHRRLGAMAPPPPPTPTPFCNIIQMLPQEEVSPAGPTKHHRRRRPGRPHPAPTFFRPPSSSKGYALGWASSSTESQMGGRERYQRDEMCRGRRAVPFLTTTDLPRRRSRRGHKRWSYPEQVTNKDEDDWIVLSRSAAFSGKRDDVERSLTFFSGGPTEASGDLLKVGDDGDPEAGWAGDWVTPGSQIAELHNEDVETRIAFFGESAGINRKTRSRMHHQKAI
ncbi:hypothetical protein FRB94_001133 [Tulasnella sp. JGI-2019a]|nr:hypothetical protein FRB94_001133 [Tulasnella sp. JGI-2019a]KAG9016439.1 hypothetical protein FRB93_010688 [Tulasnella sp. JGI-2019a]